MQTPITENTDNTDVTADAVRPRRGLAIASLSISSVGLVLALSTWGAWLLVLPWMPETTPHSLVTIVFALVLGALWFAVLPAGTLAVIFGMIAGARLRGGENLARGGTYLGLLAIAVALAGAVAFMMSASSWSWPGPGAYDALFH
ncbi:hypothetical protein [Amycolatopsis cihanbeyliensis]|uniref:Uncharacterized protein n=1 Tax=Amycolatopsis cihanbeyliensis TaxID=1128664 RepID=A0A542DFM2_AMYCI|nr:hypothetical protein [Amycolatopsis cihanbeyliensis]TQJ01821.1 hypothetical protein FB471_1537 [Amycolatopsis cihanbeyliensis]